MQITTSDISGHITWAVSLVVAVSKDDDVNLSGIKKIFHLWFQTLLVFTITANWQNDQVAVLGLSTSTLQMGDNIGFHGKVQHLINLPQF